MPLSLVIFRDFVGLHSGKIFTCHSWGGTKALVSSFGDVVKYTINRGRASTFREKIFLYCYK